MISTIAISSAVLLVTAGVVFLLARYTPIVANLFMNITIRRVHNGDVRFEGEDVTFRTADGVKLVGTLGPAPSGVSDAPVIVFCHPFTADRHSAARYASFLERGSFRVFTFDFRGHGDSEHPARYVPRQWITRYEINDLRAALRYLRDREDVSTAHVGFLGLSRGAVTAIAVASEEESVSGIVADSAFSTRYTLHSYMRRWAPIFVDPRMLLLSAPDWIFSIFRWVGTRLAEHRLGVRFVSLMPALRRLKHPVFFVHGEKDSYIDKEQAELLYELAGGGRELWIVPGAEHNGAVDVKPAEYSRRVAGFLRTSLGVTEPAVTGVSSK